MNKIIFSILCAGKLFGAISESINKPEAQIFEACKSGDLVTLQIIKNCYNQKIIHLAFQTAASSGHLSVVKCLADSAISESHLERALEFACKAGHLDIVRYLLKFFKKHKHLRSYIQVLAIKACENGHLHILKFLIKRYKLDINFQDEVGNSLLHFACNKAYLEISEFLIKTGININYRNKQNKLAFEYYPKILNLFFNKESVFIDSYIRLFKEKILKDLEDLFPYAYTLFPKIRTFDIYLQIWAIKKLTIEILDSKVDDKLNMLTNLSKIFSSQDISKIIIDHIKCPNCPEKFVVKLLRESLNQYSISDLVDSSGLTLLNYALMNNRNILTKFITDYTERVCYCQCEIKFVKNR